MGRIYEFLSLEFVLRPTLVKGLNTSVGKVIVSIHLREKYPK